MRKINIQTRLHIITFQEAENSMVGKSLFWELLRSVCLVLSCNVEVSITWTPKILLVHVNCKVSFCPPAEPLNLSVSLKPGCFYNTEYVPKVTLAHIGGVSSFIK